MENAAFHITVQPNHNVLSPEDLSMPENFKLQLYHLIGLGKPSKMLNKQLDTESLYCIIFQQLHMLIHCYCSNNNIFENAY